MHYYLVTTFKHEKFFPEMLESIIAQYNCVGDFQQNARVLVLDDASPDSTALVLQEAARKYSCIEVFVNPTNRGIGPNRNFLLDWFASRCPSANDFVLFVDGDDILPKGAMAAKLRAFSQDPELQCVGGQLSLFYGEDSKNVFPANTFPLDPDIQAIANIFECHFYVSNAMFRASVFLDPKVRFPETPTSEDWLFFTGTPLRKRHIPETTLLYRRHNHNLTSVLSDGDMVFDIRRQTRVLSLLPLGLLPSAQDCKLLDIIGYLSFQMHWCGMGYVERTDVTMPWFGFIHKRADVLQEWPQRRQEVLELLGRIAAQNDKIPVYHPTKLRAYFAAMMEIADREVAQATGAKGATAGIALAPGWNGWVSQWLNAPEWAGLSVPH